jgi:translation initiation factor 1A
MVKNKGTPPRTARQSHSPFNLAGLLTSAAPAAHAVGKGGKNRRRGKADGDSKRELTYKEDGQGAASKRPRTARTQCLRAAALHAPDPSLPLVSACWATQRALHAVPTAEYAQVTRMLGNGRLEAFCFDGVNRLCHIRGKLRKRVWIGVGAQPAASPPGRLVFGAASSALPWRRPDRQCGDRSLSVVLI